jgi:RNA polymerase sigma factor (sigma-70 family)
VQHDEEKRLLVEARAGNASAIEALVAANARAAFALAMRITRNRENAEEVVQDALVKAFKGLPGFAGQSRFSTWLYRIVYTTAINRVARYKPPMQELGVWCETDAAFAVTEGRYEELELEERRHYANLALEALSPEDRGLVTLHYYDELLLAEIADITGLSPANVKIKLYRARRKLAERLQTLLGDELLLWKTRN